MEGSETLKMVLELILNPNVSLCLGLQSIEHNEGVISTWGGDCNILHRMEE